MRSFLGENTEEGVGIMEGIIILRLVWWLLDLFLGIFFVGFIIFEFYGRRRLKEIFNELFL